MKPRLFIGDGYKCGTCGTTALKLWREYQTFADHTDLRCAACAHREATESPHTSYNKENPLERFDFSNGDQIGWWVPAVPTEDGETFWGYSSVPADRIAWWYSLPTYADAAVEIKVLRVQLDRELKRRSRHERVAAERWEYRGLLEWLDRGGGLGHNAHERIRKVLGKETS